jgi:hypothetical protein
VLKFRLHFVPDFPFCSWTKDRDRERIEKHFLRISLIRQEKKFGVVMRWGKNWRGRKIAFEKKIFLSEAKTHFVSLRRRGGIDFHKNKRNGLGHYLAA